MTVGKFNKFGDMGADDEDEGAHNHTQYNGKNNYSEFGAESQEDDGNGTVSEHSNELEQNRLETLKNCPI